MKKERFTFADLVSIVIAIIADFLFLAVFIACYLWCFFFSPTIYALVGIILVSIIPGLLVYSTTAALVEFIRRK